MTGTKEDYASPDARELSRLIAERVMELAEVEIVGERLQYYNAGMSRDRGGTWRSPVPHYATDIASAMLVVEKMREQGWRVEMDCDSEGWSVAMLKGDNKEGYAEAESLPRTICVAALEAVKEKVNE